MLNVARQITSPNFDKRPVSCAVDLLVIHSIALPPDEYGGEAIEALFTNQLNPNDHPYFVSIAHLKVSAHVLIRRTGELLQFVNFNDRAWHAGESCYKDRECCNDFSIGIELEGTDVDPFTQEQYHALAEVTGALLEHYPTLSVNNIVGHQDIAPGRKTDPGSGFDWHHYRALIKA